MRNFSKPRRAGLVVVVVALLSTLCLNLSATQSKKDSRPLKDPNLVKTPAPTRVINAAEMQSLFKRDGKRHLLVNFWATWCDPCREEFPDLVKIDRDYHLKGLEFIPISLDDLADLKTEVPKFLRKMKARMPNYLLNVPDPDPVIRAVDPQWEGSMPATFLYNNKGEVVFKKFGRVETDKLRAEIEKLVNAK